MVVCGRVEIFYQGYQDRQAIEGNQVDTSLTILWEMVGLDDSMARMIVVMKNLSCLVILGIQVVQSPRDFPVQPIIPQRRRSWTYSLAISRRSMTVKQTRITSKAQLGLILQTLIAHSRKVMVRHHKNQMIHSKPDQRLVISTKYLERSKTTLCFWRN
mmetsp:Transcript_120629/g.346603  ORF Transcript_120629/g.346603 Transcript_120629/m.346603 type:complete len:158 (-) Transcript_120629:183-656(-)